MAYLATLEGEGQITLDDLFNVNDYLGVRYFGVDTWNRIKDYVCKLTQSAIDNPTAFCIHNIKYRSKPSGECCELLGFNDNFGACVMGSTAWGVLKSKVDNELLGFNPLKSLKKAGEWVADKASDALSYVVKPTTSAAKTIVKAPRKILDYAMNKTPLQYTGTAYLWNAADDYALEPVYNSVTDVAQAAVDVPSSFTTQLVDKTPLKYLPSAQLIKAMENAKEKGGITSPGTSGVYESEDEIIQKKIAAAKAAAQAASQASKEKAMQVTSAKNAQAAAEQAAEQQAIIEATTEDLNTANRRLTSKYAPWIFAGCFGLVALSLLKK